MILYVYGLVRAAFDATRAPAGLDDAAVEVVKSEPIGALVSRLPAGAYGAAEIERNSADVSWLSPRAMAHDRVLTWAQEKAVGGVLPLPMFSLWKSQDALSRSLAGQSAGMMKAFDRVAGADEFGVRVYRRRDEDMLKAVDEFDPEFAKQRRGGDAASPGQRYLIERKYAELTKNAVRDVSRTMAKDIFENLRDVARESIARPLVPAPEAGQAPDATLVLNGAFLVDRKRLDEFRGAVAAIVQRYQPLGLSVDFTGPWPPYNFSADAVGAPLSSVETGK